MIHHICFSQFDISYVYNVGSLRPGIAAAVRAGQLSSAVTQIQAGPVTPEQYREGLQRRRNEEEAVAAPKKDKSKILAKAEDEEADDPQIIEVLGNGVKAEIQIY